jgi:hypothetical protein
MTTETKLDELCRETLRRWDNPNKGELVRMEALAESRVRALNALSEKEVEMRELRERTATLERERDAFGRQAAKYQRAANAAELEVASLRERAGDWRALNDAYDGPETVEGGFLAVGYFILGKDAPKATTWRCCRGLEACTSDDPCTACESVPDQLHLNGACTCAGEGRCGGDGTEPSVPPVEPSTAEAFATLRGLMGAGVLSEGEQDRGKAALSLLERRMGALGRALRLIEPHLPHLDDAGPSRFSAHAQAAGAVRAALTDVPPVYTLEEVEDATAEPLWEGAPIDDRAAGYRGGYERAFKTVRTRLKALRK